MTGTGRSSAGLDARRKRLLFRAWHRGIREMDFLLGRFLDAQIEHLAPSELDRLEILMGLPDPELYAWLTGAEPIPADADAAMLARIREFHLAREK